jgi:hypothetical protein
LPLAWVLAALAFGGQAQPVPYSELAGPAFVNTQIDWLYPSTYRSIREVDFKNLVLRDFDAAGKPRDEVQLSNESRKWGDGTFREEVGLDSVEYLTPAGAKGAEYALLIFHWISVGGSSSETGRAQLVRLSEHRLGVVQQLQWDAQLGSLETHAFDRARKTLVVRSAHYLPGDAHCCVSAMDGIALKWNGSAFEETSRRVELTEYGRREGRTLDQR